MVARRSRSVAVISILVVLMFLVTSAAAAMADEEQDTTEEEWVPNTIGQAQGVEPQITPYYIRTTTGAAPVTGTLSPAALNESDVLAETTVNGPIAPRILINNVGSFSMYVSRMPLYIYGVNQVALWAKSNEDVQGAQFRVHLQKNGANQRTMSTQPTQLTSAPMELTVSDPPRSFTEPLIINPGESLGLYIQYTARSRYPVGPAPGAVLLSNTLIHASRIELLASPMEMNVTAPVFAEGHMHVQGRIIDTSDVDPKEKLKINLDIMTSAGKLVKRSQITQESFAPDEEKVLVNWSWAFKKADEVTDGLFEFKLDVSYGVYGVNYTNSSFYEVVFPKNKNDEDGLLTGFNTWYLAIILIVAVVAVVGVLFIRRSRTSYPAGYTRPRRHPKKRAKKSKVPSRKERKMMMEAKNGAPPPRGPLR